jgi:poly-gamma-glutamate synthesis protein (capsule biosynthesis protein)
LAGVATAIVSCGAEPDRSGPRPFRLPGVVASWRDAPVLPVVTAETAVAAVIEAEPAAGAAAADAPARRLDPPPPPSVTFAFTGDNLTHSPIVNAAWNGQRYDFTPMFAEIAPIISWAEVGVCHLETPVAPPGEAISTYPQYGVPADITTSLAAVGYDRCSTASNHTMDRGAAGIDATVAALATAGIAQSGMARTPDEAVPQLFTVDGITFAHLSFTYGFNGASLPPGQPWRSNWLSADAVIAQARDARARGAQVVIASLHWGNEGSAAITPEQRTIAEQVTASGQVDLIVGHHVHVLQPIEQVNGRWVVYGMGNILSNLPTPTGRVWPASTQDGMIVTLSFTREPDGSVSVSRPMVVPTWVDKNDRWLIRPVQQDLVDPDVPLATRQQLAASLGRTTSVVGDFLAPSS